MKGWGKDDQPCLLGGRVLVSRGFSSERWPSHVLKAGKEFTKWVREGREVHSGQSTHHELIGTGT